MSFQAYLENIKTKTGKTPEDFRALAAKKGLVKHSEIIAWLKTDYGLGLGHARAIALVLLNPGGRPSTESALDSLFTGNKDSWRKSFDALAKQVAKFGSDVEISAGKTYVNLTRNGKKFGIIQPSAARLDIGIKLKGAAPTKRFEAAQQWNAMVTHRVRISDPKQIDAEVLMWLKQAYEAAR